MKTMYTESEPLFYKCRINTSGKQMNWEEKHGYVFKITFNMLTRKEKYD